MALRADIWTEQEAVALLAPYEEALMKAVWRAWMDREDRFMRDPMLGASFGPRLPAEFMWSRMQAHGYELLEQVCPGLRPVEVAGPTLHYELSDNIRIRFKKLDVNGMTSNILTNQERLFREHDAVTLELPMNLGKHALLAVGYVLDETGLEIIDVAISCIDPEDTSKVLWYHSILDMIWVSEVEAEYEPEDVMPRIVATGSAPATIPTRIVSPTPPTRIVPSQPRTPGVANDDEERASGAEAPSTIVARARPLDGLEESRTIDLPQEKPSTQGADEDEQDAID